MRAVRDARRICIGWRLDGLPDPGFSRRMEIFCGPGWQDRDDWAAQASDAATYPQTVALARLLASPYWRQRILGSHWAGHDEFTAELCRTVAPDYTWDYRPLTRWRRSHDDPLLEWRLHTRRLKFEPLPPGHDRNLPETIQPTAAEPIAAGHAEAPHDSDRRDDPVRQTRLINMNHASHTERC